MVTFYVRKLIELSSNPSNTRLSYCIIEIIADQDQCFLPNFTSKIEKLGDPKCKVLSVASRLTAPLSLLSVLPFYYFVYSLNGTPLEYIESEKDFGVMVTSSLDWKEQCSKVLSKANQKLGMARRNCYFVIDSNRKRNLYLTLVRSQFEHGSIIRRPVTKTQINCLERLQKRAIKWILRKECMSYSQLTNIKKCQQLKIMPIGDRFDFLDWIFFFKIVKGLVPVNPLVEISRNLPYLRYRRVSFNLDILSTNSQQIETDVLSARW